MAKRLNKKQFDSWLSGYDPSIPTTGIDPVSDPDLLRFGLSSGQIRSVLVPDLKFDSRGGVCQFE